MVSSGHYLASMAALEILEAGGNAIDAGACAGLALGVLESTYVSVAGVAPIAVRMADTGRVTTISGLGTWPQAASCAYFQEHHGGQIPKGVLRTIVPSAPDAWITALELYGTMSFGDVAAAAIRFAREGYPVYPLMRSTIQAGIDDIRVWPSTAALFLPDGQVPAVGELFRQERLGETLTFMAAEESAAAQRGGRTAGLEAARHSFYRGDIARAIVDYHDAHGGLLAMADMAGFRVEIEEATRGRFGDIDIYGCGAWCQGPMLLQELAILDGVDFASLGHNSTAYIHIVTEAIKLAAADREAYYGDPRFIDVPLMELVSAEYGRKRREMIRPDRAFPDMPAAGQPRYPAPKPPDAADRASRGLQLDTSYVCVVDRHGNAISATPSDGATTAPIIPALGFVASPRGFQSWTDPAHPSCVAPGKRPRLTPAPAIAVKEGEFVMPFGTPGHDTQTQVMLQVFLNMFAFGMDPQVAVEAPRFASMSFPSSAMPHESQPGRLLVEDPSHGRTHAALIDLGHKAERWPDDGPDYFLNASGACLVKADLRSGVLTGAADPRRPTYAVGI